MKAQERRENILTTLKGTKEAISASTLAKIFSVSRQVIVGDIALLRAQQCDIISTPKRIPHVQCSKYSSIHC